MRRILRLWVLVALGHFGCAVNADTASPESDRSAQAPDPYASAVLLSRSVGQPDGSVEQITPTNGVIVGDHWILTAAHLIEPHTSQGLAIFAFQGAIQTLDEIANLPQSRIRTVDAIVVHSDYEVLARAPNGDVAISRNDLALLRTAGEPFPKEWQAKLSGPLAIVAPANPEHPEVVDYSQAADCRVDVVTFGLPNPGIRQVFSACQTWGSMFSSPGLRGYLIESLRDYFVHQYETMKQEFDLGDMTQEAFLADLEPSMASTDVGPHTMLLPSDSVALTAQSTATSAPMRFCPGNSGSPIYLRGTNVVIGIASAGSGACPSDEEDEWGAYRWAISPNLLASRGFFDENMVGEPSPFRPK